MTDTVHINTRIRRNAETLSEALESHMLKVFAPDARKELRRFSAGEAAELLGISTSFLRKLHFDNKVVDVQTSPGGRRHYSAEDLLSIRLAPVVNTDAGTLRHLGAARGRSRRGHPQPRERYP